MAEEAKLTRNEQRINNKIERTMQKLEKLNDEVLSKILTKLRQSFNKISRTVIGDWYKDYGGNLKFAPRGYRRTLSLFKIPRFIVDKKRGKCWYVFDSDFMNTRHRVDSEYIYYNSFEQGWHGGADKLGPDPAPGYDEPHPNPGIPYWRTPQPTADEGFVNGVTYAHWYDTPAERSTPPIEIIEEQFKIESQNIRETMQHYYNTKGIALVKDLMKYIDKHN